MNKDANNAKDNIKKKKFFLIITIIILFLIVIIYFVYIYFVKKQNNKTLIDQNISKLASNIENNSTNYNTSLDEVNNRIESISKEPTESDLSSYSSPLKSKASGRLNNIRITCSKLNGTIVKSQETFSFCNTIGPSTAKDGYQEADIILNGKTAQALGGR